MRLVLNAGLKLLVSVGLSWYLVLQIDLDLAGLGGVFARTIPWLLGVAVLVFAASNVLGALQWHLLLRAQRLAITYRQSLVFYLVGVFFNNVLLGNIGGDALRIYDIRRLTGETSGGMAATFLDRFVGLFTTCSLALAAYPLIADARGPGLFSGLLVVWLGLLVLLAMGLSRRLGHSLERVSARVLPNRLHRLVSKLRMSIAVYRHQLPLLGAVLLLSLAVQFMRILVYWTAGLAVGMQAGLIHFVCFQPVAAVVAALPISIGGLGVRENLLVELFSRVEVDGHLVLAMSLWGYLAGIVASLVGGIAFVLRRVGPADHAREEG